MIKSIFIALSIVGAFIYLATGSVYAFVLSVVSVFIAVTTSDV